MLLHLCLLSLIISSCAFALNLHPSRIIFDAVTQSYPDTLIRRLFSSVPRRDFAIKGVSFQINSGDFVVMLGASSSGKSTILRLLRGTEKPFSGTISIHSTSTSIYLDRKPEYNDRNPIRSLLMKNCVDNEFGEELVGYFCSLAGLDGTKKQSELTPSENYKYGLVQACIQSIDWKMPSAPILLMDEWMDLETSAVVRIVEEAILHLTNEAGAIVLCVTHKPHLFGCCHKSITMCAGEILHASDDTIVCESGSS